MCSRTARIYFTLGIIKPFFSLIWELSLFKTCKMTVLQPGDSCPASETTSDDHVEQDDNTERLNTYPLCLEEPVILQQHTKLNLVKPWMLL